MCAARLFDAEPFMGSERAPADERLRRRLRHGARNSANSGAMRASVVVDRLKMRGGATLSDAQRAGRDRAQRRLLTLVGGRALARRRTLLAHAWPARGRCAQPRALPLGRCGLCGARVDRRGQRRRRHGGGGWRLARRRAEPGAVHCANARLPGGALAGDGAAAVVGGFADRAWSKCSTATASASTCSMRR